MKSRSVRDEKRRGIKDIVVGAVVLAGMLALWWLVATTNREGHHDAQLLPLFALIPLGLALWHFGWAWFLARSEAHVAHRRSRGR